MKKKNRCADEFPSSSIRKYIGYPDSAYIHFDEVGAVLFIFRANPSLKELDGFEKKFEIRITEFSKINCAFTETTKIKNENKMNNTFFIYIRLLFYAVKLQKPT